MYILICARVVLFNVGFDKGYNDDDGDDDDDIWIYIYIYKVWGTWLFPGIKYLFGSAILVIVIYVYIYIMNYASAHVYMDTKLRVISMENVYINCGAPDNIHAVGTYLWRTMPDRCYIHENSR